MISGCSTTSDIDTTLGSVSPTAQEGLLPPPARPDSTELAVQESAPAPAPAPAIVTQSEPQVPATPTQEGAVAQTPPPPVDDLVPTLTMRNTGTFPNINEERAPSLRQFTPEERESLSAYMAELSALHQGGQLSTAQYERRLAYLQNLARTHSRDALRQIGAL
ncbi:MAG: hypothetical protein AAF940_01235 [Pseudomonadota bacterium]